MCCAMEGDFHDLPTHLAQTIFESEGWEVLNFGANTPLYCLAEEVLRHSPEAVCIVATVITDVERLDRDYKIFTEQIADLKIPIILGGRAFKDEAVRRRFPADVYARRFAEVVERLRDFPERRKCFTAFWLKSRLFCISASSFCSVRRTACFASPMGCVASSSGSCVGRFNRVFLVGVSADDD